VSLRQWCSPPAAGGAGAFAARKGEEILPGQQIRSLRQNSVSFANLTAGSFRGTTATSAADPAQAPQGVAEATDTADKVIDLFNKLKKK